MLAALERAGGDVSRVKRIDDPDVFKVVGPWPARFDATRARALGFNEAPDIDAVVAEFLAEDLSATKALRA